jgi:hypothetical protein
VRRRPTNSELNMLPAPGLLYTLGLPTPPYGPARDRPTCTVTVGLLPNINWIRAMSHFEPSEMKISSAARSPE